MSSYVYRPTNVKIKMEGRPPPDDPSSNSIPDVLQDSFSALTIGTRKKEKVKSYSSKEDEISLEEDSDSQDANIFEKWNSLDRITVDGSESSEWERSVSSSMSWFDESENEATFKVKSMMDNIENMLYGETHTPLPKPLIEECQQWKQRFPHLRVVGTGLRIHTNQDPEDDLGSSEDNSPSNDAENLDNSRKKLSEGQEEGVEEVYASHGMVAIQPVLSHKFRHHHEPIKDAESERIKESLLDEMTKHVWREVVVPSLKPFIENHVKKRCDAKLHTSKGGGEPSGASVIKDHYDTQDVQVKGACASGFQTQQSAPLSAREMRTFSNSSYDLDDPFECYRRYSEQLTYCDLKFSSEFTSLETVTEVEDVRLKNDLEIWNFSKSRGKEHHGRLSCGNDFERRVPKRSSPEEESLRFLSPQGLMKIGMVEDLKPLEKATAWMSSKSENLQYLGKYLPPKQTRHLTLPAIEHRESSPNCEPSSLDPGRSSSALPKLASKRYRPTMSSYQNKHTEKHAAGRKFQPSKYNEAEPLESEGDVKHRFTRNPRHHSGQSTSRSRNNKQRKDSASKGSQNVDRGHS